MKILRLPVNEYWYRLILSGELTHDYREIKPYWTNRLEGKEYDVVEFYHRFKKNIPPIRYKFDFVSYDTSYNKCRVLLVKDKNKK